MSSCVSGTLNVKLQFVLGRREVVKTFALELKHFVSGTINIANIVEALVYIRTTNLSY